MFNDDEDSSGKARYEMKTKMLLFIATQLSAAKKIKTEELDKEVAGKENVSCTCGGGYSRF